MCGRIRLPRLEQAQQRLPFVDFHERRIPAEMPRFNVAPTQQILAARADGGCYVAEGMRWGFQPTWMRDPKQPRPSMPGWRGWVDSKLFRGALARHRCLIPVDGFYEWKALDGKRKQPYAIQFADGDVFCLAGLYTPPAEDAGGTCTIITCEPNELMATIHNRMPVILSPDDELAWLDPAVSEPLAVLPLLRAYPAERMTAYAVSTLVNRVTNDGPELLAPSEDASR